LNDILIKIVQAKYLQIG